MRLATALAALGLLCSTVSVDAGSRMDAGSPTDSAEPPFIVPTLPDRQCRSPLLSGSPDQLIVNTFDELVSFWHGMMGDLYDRKPLMALHSTDTGQTAPPAPSGGTGAVVTVLAWADLQPLSPDGVPLEYRHWKFRGDHTLPGWADADYPGHPGRPGLLKVPPIDSRTGNGFGPPNPSVTRPWTKFVPFINFEFFHFNNPHIPYRMIEWNDAAYNKWLGMANNDLFAEVIVLAHEFGHYMQLVGGRIEIPELTGPLSDNPYDPIGEIASHGYYEPD